MVAATLVQSEGSQKSHRQSAGQGDIMMVTFKPYFSPLVRVAVDRDQIHKEGVLDSPFLDVKTGTPLSSVSKSIVHQGGGICCEDSGALCLYIGVYANMIVQVPQIVVYARTLR